MQLLWALEGIRSPFLTAVFSVLSLLGEQALVVAVICALYWCVDKELAFGLCISFFVSALLVQGLKIVIRIERPWVLDPAFLPVAAAVPSATGFSFPSGHTQAAAALLGYLGIASGKRRWVVIAWLLVALVALSRMYLGVHTLLDVSAAMAIVLIVILLTRALLRSEKSEILLPGIVGGLAVLVLAVALALRARGTIEAAYAADCVKAAGGCIGCAIGFVWARRAIPFPTAMPRLWQQAVKWMIGLCGLLLIQNGTKLLVPDSLPLDAIRYALIALWALALYPLLFSRFAYGADA